MENIFNTMITMIFKGINLCWVLVVVVFFSIFYVGHCFAFLKLCSLLLCVCVCVCVCVCGCCVSYFVVCIVSYTNVSLNNYMLSV